MRAHNTPCMYVCGPNVQWPVWTVCDRPDRVTSLYFVWKGAVCLARSCGRYQHQPQHRSYFVNVVSTDAQKYKPTSMLCRVCT